MRNTVNKDIVRVPTTAFADLYSVETSLCKFCERELLIKLRSIKPEWFTRKLTPKKECQKDIVAWVSNMNQKQSTVHSICARHLHILADEIEREETRF